MTEPQRLTAPEQQSQDVENTLQPQTLADFTGQRQVCENLKVFIDSALARKEPLDHVLLYGPPGLGKTTLAQIVARELSVGFRATSGPMLTKAGDLAAILTNLQPHDVLFIDEIHRLNASVEETLYPALEDFRLDIIIGEGPAARAIRIDLPPFTLVGATTRLGLLSNPLRDRFGIPLRLQFYEVKDLQIVIERAADIMKMKIDKAGSQEIARRSRGTPRIAVRLLKRVRDFALADKAKIITREGADAALGRLEVDMLGLDSADRRYMMYVCEHYSGGPVGIETIAAGLSEQRDTLEETIEPFLMQVGFIQRTQRGRMLTQKAFAHLGLKAPTNLAKQMDLLDE